MSGRGQGIAAELRSDLTDFVRRSREEGPDRLRRVAAPRRFEKQADAATRGGQILAALVLGPVIVVNLALIVAFNQVIGDILTNGEWTGHDAQAGIAAWFVTVTTIVVFGLSGWIWFQWVRTAAFGFFTMEIR